MKKILFFIAMTFSLAAIAGLLTPIHADDFSCEKSTSVTSIKLKSILEDQEHDFDVDEKFSRIITSAGYESYSREQIINCSNVNSKGVDFELLRKYTINSIVGRRLL